MSELYTGKMIGHETERERGGERERERMEEEELEIGERNSPTQLYINSEL